MKITKLYIKNINSLKGEHYINFDEAPLSSTGLFAITGPTGAGKSTMLDSITLALYNQIPRSGKLSKKSIQEFGTLITRGTDECLVELDFQVNGKTYRSKWGISRARTGNLRDYHMELSFLNEKEEWELFDLKKSDIPAKNTELTGLNYDQFVKSILLSQGEFAKFLKAPQNERSELLEKITGTEIYRQIGKAAYERWKKEEEELKRIQLRIEHIELLSEEEKEKLTEELQKLRKDSEELKKLMTLLLAQLKVKEEIKKQTSQQEKIKASLEELTKEQEEFSPELERLKQHKQILPLQADIRELQSNQRENKNLLEALVQLEKDIQTQKVKNEECSKGLRENQQKHESLQKEFSDWEPKWTACLQLDEQMKSESKREDELKVDLEKKSKEILKNDEERKQLQKNQSEVKQKLDRLQQMLEKNQVLEDYPVVNEKVEQQLSGIKEAHASLNQEVKQLPEEWQEEFASGKKWSSKKQLLAIEIEQCDLQVKKWDEQLANVSFANREELNELVEKWNEQKEAIQQVKQLFSLYEQDKEKEKQQKEELLKLCEEIKKQSSQIEKSKPLLEIKKLEEKEYQLKVDRLKIESSLTVHRQNLKVDEACPLCGSLEHPYVKTYEEKTDEAKTHLKKITKEKEALDKQLQVAEKEFAGKQSEQKSLEKQQKELDANIDKLKKQFAEQKEKLQFSFELGEQNFYQTFIEEKKKEEEKLHANRDAFEKREKELALLKLLNEIADKVNVISDAQLFIDDVLKPFQHLLVEEANIAAKMKDLKKQYEQYQKQKQDVLEFEKGKLQSTEKLNSLQESIVRLQKEKEDLQEKCSKIQEQLKKLRQNRFDLLGDKSVEKEQEKWNKHLQDIRKQCEQEEKELAVAKEKEKNLLKLQSETIAKQKKLATLIQAAEVKLLEQLKQYQIQKVDVASERLLSKEIAGEIEKKERSLEERKVAFNQTKKETEERLKILLAKDNERDYEGLFQEKEEKEQENNSLNQTIGAIVERQKKDESNRKLAGDFLKELEKQQKECKRWANLNELIGDATGNKYSKFAQELTLRQMLSLANQHLLKLNPRYLLKFDSRQSEDLFVVDTLQGNEERSVKTLSGGESFLISLALALGLSDLAGQNTQLESLFIDEGFGSLDQETLESALETLERLQSESNRTIGIISHVEALKERITTQIELVKDSSGNSQIFVR